MKIKTTLLIAITLLLFACDSADNQNNNSLDLNSDSIHSISYDYTPRERRIRYNNELFLFSTKPYSNFPTNEYNVEVKLVSKRDTIYTLILNTDTLLNHMLQNTRFLDSVKLNDIKEYKLVSLLPMRWIRGYNSYFIGKFSKHNSDDVFLHFALKAFTTDHKIWMMNLSYNKEPYQRECMQLENEVALTQVAPTNIELHYELGDTSTIDGTLHTDLKYTVINKSDKPIEYISNSGSGLDRFLVVYPSNNKISPYFLCNASWPVIHKISANDSVSGNTRISRHSASKPFTNLALDFRMVKRNKGFAGFPLGIESLKDIYNSEASSGNLILGQTNNQ